MSNLASKRPPLHLLPNPQIAEKALTISILSQNYIVTSFRPLLLSGLHSRPPQKLIFSFCWISSASRCRRHSVSTKISRLFQTMSSPRGTPYLPGCDPPACNEDGSFPSKQCQASVGVCHCEYPNGTQIPGTVRGVRGVRFILDCDAIPGKSWNLKACVTSKRKCASYRWCCVLFGLCCTHLDVTCTGCFHMLNLSKLKPPVGLPCTLTLLH